jgi:hypothetical protein
MELVREMAKKNQRKFTRSAIRRCTQDSRSAPGREENGRRANIVAIAWQSPYYPKEEGGSAVRTEGATDDKHRRASRRGTQDRENAVNREDSGSGAEFGTGLGIIRRRRRYLWVVILVYLPAMWLALRMSVVGSVFAVWFVLLFTAALVSAVARCPRCGNYFHMHGMTLFYFRKCLHCQLHINADRKK